MLMTNNDYLMLVDIVNDMFADVSSNDSNELYKRLDECTLSKTPEDTESNDFIKKACRKIKNIVSLERRVA